MVRTQRLFWLAFLLSGKSNMLNQSKLNDAFKSFDSLLLPVAFKTRGYFIALVLLAKCFILSIAREIAVAFLPE